MPEVGFTNLLVVAFPALALGLLRDALDAEIERTVPERS